MTIDNQPQKRKITTTTTMLVDSRLRALKHTYTHTHMRTCTLGIMGLHLAICVLPGWARKGENRRFKVCAHP